MQIKLTKRAISLILAILMIISMTTVALMTVSAADADTVQTGIDQYYIAGTMNSWSATANSMTKSTDTAGTTIFYAGPYTTQHQFKITDGTNWYGFEISTNALYDNSLAVYDYGSTGNCWPDVAASYYVVFTTSAGGNAISCVTQLPTGSQPIVPTSTQKPTISVRDGSNSGFALWAWTSSDANLFSSTWATRPTSASKTPDANGWRAYTADNSIGLNLQYSLKLTRGASTSNESSWLETIAHGNFWIDIDAEGNITCYNHNPDSTDAVSKSTAFQEGLWVDTQSDEITDDTDITALVKWYEKANKEFRLYLPSGMSLTNVPVYHTYSSLKINGTEVASGSTFTFTPEITYTLSGSISGNLKVVQSANVYTMYMTGNTDLPNDKSSILVSKDSVSIEGGNIYTADSSASIKYQDTVKKIKGRGNSSWEASYSKYGKYAFNLTLKNKTKDITGGAVKTKKYSMLANNADESMIRNMVVYSLADDIGLDYTPKIRVYDFYNNGNYLGSYSVCEKVEVGSSSLLSGVSVLDDANAEVNPDIESAPQKTNGLSSSTKGFYKYVDSPDPEDITGGYLLEFELSERFDAEISGFVSDHGQDVVVKYPEFATKNEVLYIKNLFNMAENAIYSSSADINEISKYIDVESFAKMYLIQEMTKNLDAAQTSFYIYKQADKDGDGKLHASPVWDYDWTLGQYVQDRPVSSGSPSVLSTSGWTTRYRYIDNNAGKGLNLQSKLCECSGFWNLVKSVWHTNFYTEASKYVFDDNNKTLADSSSIITSYYNKTKDSIGMNESRWGFLKSDLLTEWGSADTGDSVYDTIDYLNDWMFDRVAWMNSNIGAKPTHSVPSLNITVSDSNGAVATTGTVESPVLVSSDLTITTDNQTDMLYTMEINGKTVYPDSNGKYTVAIAEDAPVKVSYTATARKATVASTDTDYIAQKSGEFYVTTSITYLIGDADLDSYVTVLDATKIQQFCVLLATPSDLQKALGDVDNDGKVTVKDATHIQRYLVDLSCSELIDTPYTAD